MSDMTSLSIDAIRSLLRRYYPRASERINDMDIRQFLSDPALLQADRPERVIDLLIDRFDIDQTDYYSPKPIPPVLVDLFRHG